MEKRTMVLVTIAVVSLLVVAGTAMAQGFWRNKQQNWQKGMLLRRRTWGILIWWC